MKLNTSYEIYQTQNLKTVDRLQQILMDDVYPEN